MSIDTSDSINEIFKVFDLPNGLVFDILLFLCGEGGGGTKIPLLRIIPISMWFICRKQVLEQRRLSAVNKTVQWFILPNQTKSSMSLNYHKRNMSEKCRMCRNLDRIYFNPIHHNRLIGFIVFIFMRIIHFFSFQNNLILLSVPRLSW